jgi:hypothetical protein
MPPFGVLEFVIVALQGNEQGFNDTVYESSEIKVSENTNDGAQLSIASEIV